MNTSVCSLKKNSTNANKKQLIAELDTNSLRCEANPPPSFHNPIPNINVSILSHKKLTVGRFDPKLSTDS